MKKFHQQKSFGLLEVVFASAILILFLIGGILLLRGSLRSVVTGKHRISALSLGNQQMETARSIRDALYFQGSLSLYTAFDSFGTPTCFDANGPMMKNGQPYCPPANPDDPNDWDSVVRKEYPEVCYNESYTIVPCTDPTWFYKVQVVVTPYHLIGVVDRVEVIVTWNEYGTTKTSSLDTYILGCPGLSYTIQVPGPVDVIQIIDHTGSMATAWAYTPPPNPQPISKLDTAKSVLTTFNSHMNDFNIHNPPRNGIAQGRVGLISLPKCPSQPGGICPVLGTAYPYLGWLRNSLTGDMGLLNSQINSFHAAGATPIADALHIASTQFDNQNPGATRVIILASDGIANILNGTWYCGENPSNSSPCVVGAINEARAIKSMSPQILIFTIAIGNDFDSYTLQQIASGPGKPYFQTATDPATLQNIYDEIFQIVTNSHTEQVCPGHAPS